MLDANLSWLGFESTRHQAGMYIQHPCIDLHTSALCWHELATNPWHDDDGARTAGSNVPRDKSTCLPLHTLVWRACCVCIDPNDETGERGGRKGLLSKIYILLYMSIVGYFLCVWKMVKACRVYG